MEELSGGEMVVRALADEGVEFIFGYPGGAVLHIYDALFQQDQVAHILVRHEQAATHAADGYARATGKPGAVLVTSGPGATNAITGIATASMDSIPMVVISGQVISEWIGDDAFQETDTLGISRPLVKHSWMVRDPREIPDIFRKAFYIANSGRPGPVLIDIPKDMTAPHNKYPYEYPEQVQMRSYNPVTRGHSGQIRKAVNAMLQAKRPVIYAGGGAIQGEAHEVLTRLARKLNFPVTNTLMGLGAYPGSDPQFLGMLGQHGTYEANMAMHHADFILCAGARLDDRVTNNADKFCPSATLVHIDVDPASISKNVPANIPIVGPLDQVLGEMLDMVEHSEDQPDEKDLERWWEEVQGWSQYHGLRYERDADGPMKPQQVVETLYEVTHGDAYVTSDVGQHQMFAAQFYKFDHPRYWINSGGLGTMGFGFPAAMGVQFAYPDAMVACVTGEGSILMNIQELSTCLQYGLPIKIININNQALGMVRQWQDMQYGGRHSQSYMDSLPDFIALAQAYGHVGMKVERAEDLDGAMKEAFAMTDRLVFMDIYVDPAEHVYPMHIAGGAINDMWLSKTERT